MRSILKHTWRVIIFCAGLIVFLAGLVLSLPGVPGPGIVLIIAALAIWATEFMWAQNMKTKVEDWFKANVLDRLTETTSPNDAKTNKK